MKVFFDLKLTGLHQHTTPISIGLIAENKSSFYAEFTDHDPELNDWLRNNIMPCLRLGRMRTVKENTYIDKELHAHFHHECYNLQMVGTRFEITRELISWLEQFGVVVEMWGDCLTYAWVVFRELFGGKTEYLPENILCIPFDICTVLQSRGIDPNISRQGFAGMDYLKHHALWDAMRIKKCYERLNTSSSLVI